jgi:diketogulonate reductase-like aldo/keto reductase
MAIKSCLSFAVAFAVAGVAFSAVVPTATIAPGVHLPFLTMGGVNRTDYPFYPDYSNYTLWASLGGTGFDTAWEYRTQAGVSRAMVASGVPREELFLTTKIPGSLHGGCCGCPGAGPPGTCLAKCHGVCFPASGHYRASDAAAYIKKDLQILKDNGVDYIDLLLLHEPCDFLAPYPYNASAETSAVYGAMEAALLSEDPAMKGRIKAIGVSNFGVQQLKLLSQTNPRTVPAVNQCRMSLGEYDAETHAYCTKHGITYQAYSTLHGNIHDPVVESIAAKHNVSVVEVTMRWVTQLGVPIVTASENPAHDLSDMSIFGFELSDEEMAALSKVGPSPKYELEKK